MLIIVH